jgi:5'(3')-deoxyribonucleotidase
MSGRIRIAVDMDDVLADTLTVELGWLRAEYGFEVTRETLAGHSLADLVPAEQFLVLEEVMRQGDFFADIPVIDGSQRVLRELARRFDVFIATAAMEYPGSFAAKFGWLAKHFPFIPAERIVFCGDKGIVAADYLIDDSARHFRSFRGRGVLFTAPHNIALDYTPRVDDWEDVARMFLGGAAETLRAAPPPATARLAHGADV